VDTTTGRSSKGNVGFLVDLGESRVESLASFVVENTWGSVMLLSNGTDGADVLGLSEAGLVVSGVLGAETGNITVLLFASLVGVFLGLDGEVVLNLVTRSETPVSALRLSPLDLLLLSSTEEVSSPGSAATEVVPVSVTVDGNG